MAADLVRGDAVPSVVGRVRAYGDAEDLDAARQQGADEGGGRVVVGIKVDGGCGGAAEAQSGDEGDAWVAVVLQGATQNCGEVVVARAGVGPDADGDGAAGSGRGGVVGGGGQGEEEEEEEGGREEGRWHGCWVGVGGGREGQRRVVEGETERDGARRRDSERENFYLGLL